jgi:hypothetical protein
VPTLVLFAAGVALALWCLVDLLPREDAELQGLPKLGWVVVVLLLFPLLGGLAYLLAGRSPQARTARPGGRARGARRGGALPPAPPARGPEDDPEFQAQLRRRVEEQRRRAARQRNEEQPES